MARVLIAGCGVVGSASGRVLAGLGHEVYGLRRHPPADTDSIRYIQADLSAAADLTGIDTDFDVVIYILTPDTRDVQSYRKVFVSGLENLIQVFSQNNSSARFVFVSSTSVYGKTHGEWVDERSIAEPVSATGRILRQAEQTVLASGDHNCVVRFSGIYGRGRSHLIDAVLGQREIQFEPPYFMNRIHWQDCVDVVAFIVRRMIDGDELEHIYLASDDDPSPKWEVFCYLADMLGVLHPGKLVMPPGTPQNKRCSNRRLKQLGYRFRFPSYRQGFSDVGPSDIDK